MLDTAHMAMMTAYAHEAGAKLILVGDDRQLASIERGGMFGVLKDRFGAATLTEIKRQITRSTTGARASISPRENFTTRSASISRRAAIHWTRTQGRGPRRIARRLTRATLHAPTRQIPVSSSPTQTATSPS